MSVLGELNHSFVPHSTPSKVGYNSVEETSLSKISDEDIISANERANKEAVRVMNELGISFTKEETRDIISKPVKAAHIDEIDDDDNDEEDYDNDNGNLVGDIRCNGTTESENEDFVTDIAAMEQFGMIDKGECGKIRTDLSLLRK